jgi:hypothetical protein
MNWTQGTTYTPASFTATGPNGAALNLTGLSGSNITLRMRPNAPVSKYGALAGAATITTAVSGLFTYAFAASDVAVAGSFFLVIDVMYSGVPVNSAEIPFIISQAT